MGVRDEGVESRSKAYLLLRLSWGLLATNSHPAQYNSLADASRVVQACFVHGDEHMRKTILDEIKGIFVELAKGKYSKFLVMAFIRVGSKSQRKFIVKQLRG